jgi:hypothetical protein
MNHMRTSIGTILFFGAAGAIAACGKISGLDDVERIEDSTTTTEDGGPSARPDATPTSTPPDSGPAKPSCTPLGTACTTSGECCKTDPSIPAGGAAVCGRTSATCTTCKAANAFCAADDICCSGGACNTATGKCPNDCVGTGVACDNDGQCCDVTNPNAKFECRADKKCAKCEPAASTCVNTVDCCTGLKCKGNKRCGQCIVQNGTGCTNNDDCCDGFVCSTDVDTPATTRCVAKCWPQWTIGNPNIPCKNGTPVISENHPCCAPFKCNFAIPSSSATGCGP